MAAGELPRLDDFFVAGDHDEYSLDRVGLRLSREAVAWSLERLARDPALLDYVSLAVPRGFLRPGAVAPGARVTLHPGRGSRRARRPAGRRARRLRGAPAPRAIPSRSALEGERVALAARPRRRRPRDADRAACRRTRHLGCALHLGRCRRAAAGRCGGHPRGDRAARLGRRRRDRAPRPARRPRGERRGRARARSGTGPSVTPRPRSGRPPRTTWSPASRAPPGSP